MKHVYILVLCISFSFLQTANTQNEATVYPFAHHDKWGIVDENRQEIYSPQLDSLGFFLRVNNGKSRTLAIVDNKMGLIDRDGHWIIDPKMDRVFPREDQNDRLHIVIKKGRYGVINTAEKKAKWLVRPKYTHIDEFYGSEAKLSIVTKPKGKGVINGEGKMVIPCTYEDIEIEYGYMDFPLIKTIMGEEIIYFNYQGETADLKKYEDEYDQSIDVPDLEADYERPPAMAPDLRIEKKDAGETIISLKADGHQETVIVPVQYTVERVKLSNDFIPKIRYIYLSNSGKYGFMNPLGEIITPVKFDRVEWDEQHQYCTLYLGDNIGLTDYNAKQVYPAIFSTISRFQYYGWIHIVTHHDGYTGFAKTNGKIFLPDYVDLEEKQ